MIAIFFKWFSVVPWAARIPGILSNLATLLIVYKATKDVLWFSGRVPGQWPIAMAFFLSIIPAFVQSAMTIQIDCTILVPGLLLVVWGCYRYCASPGFYPAMMVIAGCALSLWCRISTPVIVIILIMLMILLMKLPAVVKTRLPLACVLGIATFWVTWLAYCFIYKYSPMAPVVYTLDSFISRAGGDPDSGNRAFQVMSSIIYFSIWIGPPVFVLLFPPLISQAKTILSRRGFAPYDLFTVCGFVILSIYMVIGGSTFGFPRYQMPAIPLLMIGSACWFYDKLDGSMRRISPWKLMLPLCVFALFVGAAGDPLLFFRYSIRELLANDVPRMTVLMRFAEFSLIYLVCAAAALSGIYLMNGKRMAIILLIAAFNIGLLLRQECAGYQTGINYGERGQSEVLKVLDGLPSSGKRVLAVPSILSQLKTPPAPFPDKTWNDAALLVDVIEDESTIAVVSSITVNTIAQQKLIQRENIQEALSKHYREERIGSFRIWIAKQVER